MRVLLSNDDGFFARGIKSLREKLESLAEIEKIYVVAPDRERSAIGHGITMHRPLRIKEIKYDHEKSVGWSVDGTPADCVKLAIEELLEEPPDIVVSGINQGPNLGNDVLYSGTVSAAVEGLVCGVPSIAVSLTSFKDSDFTYAAEFAGRLILQTVRQGVPGGTLLNVNVPPGKPAGVKVVRLGHRKYINIFDRRNDPRGRTYFWMAGEIQRIEDNSLETDVGAVENGFISVTPVHIDLTDYSQIKRIKAWDL